MKPQQWILLVSVLALIAGAAVVLQHAGSLHKLGPPGLKLIEQAAKRSPDIPYFRQQRDRIQKGDPSVPPPEPEQQ